MIEKIISFSIRNRLIVLGVAAILFGWGLYSVDRNPVDAIPDLSENQVIVYTEWMGRSPQIIEDQITYPLVSNLQGVPNVKSIRANSMFGMSFVFVIFNDDTDIYWARTRVLERLNYAQRLLPDQVVPTLGPDGTGVGHIFWYTLDAPGFDLAELRTLQDWYIRFALQNVPGVSEVASFGGFQKQYQIAIDPHKLNFYNIPLSTVLSAVKSNNNDVGGRTFEMSGSSYLIRGLGYIKNLDDIRKIPLGTFNSVPVTVQDVAAVQTGGELRLGITEENGQGEVVGGIVVMRYGENARELIDQVKMKMEEVEKGLPPGVKFKIVYDRSDLIDAAVATLREALIEEILVVSLVILIFLFHFRSALVAMITIPLSVLIGFILMNVFDVTSNIMSLGGIALAIGDLVDAGIVMVENAYRNLSEGEGVS
ncbi:efflux RND transporter permease subunit [Adhaeribacter sp. BT258]|uniref:Efflux RND transporter permease subunit n=1 Tax=Adhaeribacter terrigena TaxID=2793070 RepID=A0ABS1BXJ3_9BACT|nr:efflux RND transporter permease subunit [Adhaeribacter terrigena]MBK0401854.1 efflux RND transporter permease subunit [Adhaeribacter terrigena]